MVENTKNPIRIDLNEFKLHIHLKNRIQLTLYFNSPSRQFYLSVIALVVNEMKKFGKITSIPLERHLGLLALLNETIGGSAGSSDRENLIPRIYRKWKDVLPDLEKAHLFKILGRRKEFDEGIGRTYPFVESEKDNWANLFDYQGSEENVRLKFALDRVGATLDDIVIIYGDSSGGDAWDQFISSLKNGGQKESEPVEEPEPLEISPPPRQKQNISWKYRWAMIVVVIAIVAAGIWEIYLNPAPIEVASVDRLKYHLPDAPSIAVLPFVNMSADPKQEYLADGLAEEIINGLSKCPHIVVIARNSSFTYKGKSVKVQQVAEELGVRHIVEGSIRKTGNRVRIAVQLIDALTGQHLFSERYDRELKDILDMQDEITMKILDAAQVKLTVGEDARLRAKGTTNLEAYLKLMQARQYMQTYNKGNYALARQLTQEAIALDSHYAVAYATLCRIQLMEFVVGIYKNRPEALEEAAKLGEKAVTLDDSNALAPATLSAIYLYLKNYDKAISEAEKAVSLAPNSAYAHLVLGSALQYAGRPHEGIPFLKKSIRLSPIPTDTTALIILGAAYRQIGQYEEAAASFKKTLQLFGADDLLAHLNLAATYALMGHEEEARVEAAEVLRLNPTFSAESFGSRLPYKNQKAIDDLVSGLYKAGLK